MLVGSPRVSWWLLIRRSWETSLTHLWLTDTEKCSNWRSLKQTYLKSSSLIRKPTYSKRSKSWTQRAWISQMREEYAVLELQPKKVAQWGSQWAIKSSLSSPFISLLPARQWLCLWRTCISLTFRRITISLGTRLIFSLRSLHSRATQRGLNLVSTLEIKLRSKETWP